MKISVWLDEEQRKYVILSDDIKIAELPLIYLEGRKASHIGERDIYDAYEHAYNRSSHALTPTQRSDTALIALGLISH